MLIVVVIVLFICLLFAADRTVKAVKRGRRRRDASQRLAAAAARGEAKHRQRKAAKQAGEALTSVMPTIHDVDTRHVDRPSPPPATTTM